MGLASNLLVVFVAGLITALATGLGAIPFFLFSEISDRWNVALWGVASGIMLSASVFGLLNEGLAEGTGPPYLLGLGIAAGVVLVVVSNRILARVDVGGSGEPSHGHESDSAHDHGSDSAHDPDAHSHNHDHHSHDADHDHHVDPIAIAEGDVRKLVLILGVLTVHSFPEGVAIGVSFAELGLEGGLLLLGVSVPILAVFMTIAISIHNVPEGLAISIPLRAMDVSEWRMVGAAVFSSLPQPIGAVIAFAFVRVAREFLPFGFGFAAGAMIYLVLSEFIPEALEAGAGLESRGYTELALGLAGGFALMIPLAFV